MAKTQPFDQYPDTYEEWFTANKSAYESELEAVRYFIPDETNGIEIGVGSGIFARPLGIPYGVEPSATMRKKAEERGITVYDGTAENLPLKTNSFDFALMVTTICFVDQPQKAIDELFRIIRPGGRAIIGFVDKDSPVGKQYQQFKDESVFYKDAKFFSTAELLDYLENAGFERADTVQTIFGDLESIDSIQPYKPGFGNGSFVVIAAEKSA